MAIKSSEVLSISGILREAFRICLRNGKLMVVITLLIQFTFSFLALANIYCLQPFISSLFTKVLQLRRKNRFSSSFGVEKEIFLVTAVELIFLIAYSTALLCSVVATTYHAATSYRKKDFNFKELILKIQRTCGKPMISWFFVAQLGVGYTVQVLALLAIFIILSNGSLVYAFLGVAFIFLSLCFNLYVAGVWMLGFVNSVLENSYELASVEEEEDGLNGGRKMLRGSVVKFFLVLLTIILFLCYKLRGPDQIIAPGLVRVLVVINLICLVKIFSFTAYTVFYFRCKKIYAEELGGKKGNSRVLNGSSSCS